MVKKMAILAKFKNWLWKNESFFLFPKMAALKSIFDFRCTIFLTELWKFEFILVLVIRIRDQ